MKVTPAPCACCGETRPLLAGAVAYTHVVVKTLSYDRQRDEWQPVALCWQCVGALAAVRAAAERAWA